MARAGSADHVVRCAVPLYAWQKNSVLQRDWEDAHLTNAALDVHHDDPAFGYRFIADELLEQGFSAGENRVARLCSEQRIWSVFAEKRGLNRKPGPPVHEDLVDGRFTAPGPNLLWLTEITEHRTGEGKLYLCAIKDVQLEQDRRILDRLADEASLAVARRSSSRVAQRCRSRTFFCSSAKKGSMAALSPYAPTRPIEPTSPLLRCVRTQAVERNWPDSTSRRNTGLFQRQ